MYHKIVRRHTAPDCTVLVGRLWHEPTKSQRPLRKGDRVKLNLCSLTPEGTIVDEYSDDYVSVQWDDLPSPATYSRRSLVLVDGESRAA